MIRRRTSAALAAALFVLAPHLLAASSAQDRTNEIRIISETGPGTIPVTQIDGVDMIPLRGIASFIGARVRPSSERGSVNVSGNLTLSRITDGRNLLSVGDGLVLLTRPATMVGDEWYVPLDFLTKVAPELSEEEISFRENERLLVIGANYPQLEVHSRRDPNYTQVEVALDQPVPIHVERIGDEAIRIELETPYLTSRFQGEEVGDGVLDRITLSRDEPSYVVTVHLDDRFGRLEMQEGPASVVLDLFRSRVPTRNTATPDEPEEIEEDLRSMEARENAEGEGGLDPEGENPGAPGAEDAGPIPETVELPEDFGLERTPPELPDPASGPSKLRIVTIDPGHGGSETGAEGQGGSLEKNVTLAISRRLRDRLERGLGVRVILTRDGDRDLSLDDRAAIANSNKSNLFISIHADASPRRNARGSSVYFLSYSSADAQNRRLSMAESRSGREDLDFILWDMAQASHLSQSSRLAEIMQEELLSATGASERINRGIKQNTFRVLKGATMPAVLVEVGFISNPDEEKLLGSEEYQEALAEALYRGIVRYRNLVESGSSRARTSRGQR